MNFKTTYMGLDLKNPLVSAAGPLSREIGTIRQLEDAGAGAVVLHSLFEEQLSYEAAELDHYLRHGTESYSEAQTYFPDAGEYKLGPDEYLEHISKAKKAVNIPIIASLNGVTPGGWIDYAALMEKAGADALELNVYFIPTDPRLSSEDVERLYLTILEAVKSQVRIPVAMKLSPFFSAMASMARRLDEAGADALVLFNRFYQPDIDLDALEVVPNVVLSTPHAMRLPLRWVAVLYGQLKASLAGASGIASAEDVVKMIMVGADVVQICSALLRKGPRELSVILKAMQAWMEEKEYESIEQMKGSMSQRSCREPAAFERANYIKTLRSYV